MRKVEKRSIRTRILAGILALLGIAFASVFVVFNISVQQYIDSNSKRQLDIAKEMMTRKHHPDGPRGEDGQPPNMDAQPKNPIGAEAKVFFWDGVSELTQDGADTRHAESNAAVAKQLDVESVLDSTQVLRTESGVFLVTAMHDAEKPGEYIVLYVDITDMQTLIQNINVFLIIILVVVGVVAVAVAILISNSVAKPIKQISGFAQKIGEGVFEPVDLTLKDRETSNLLNVMNTTAVKLEEYDREQKTFFQNVSHELKTPLMTIRCNAEGIACNVMQPQESSRLIIKETDRLGELIDALLYVSKLDTITENELLENCDLREVLSSCAERQKTVAEQKNIQFAFDFSDQPVIRKIAEKSVKRALGNIISNAIRYAKSKVEFYCHMQDGKAVVRICDDGSGVSPEDLSHVFERFYKGAGGGHGIGLSIVKSVVDKHGGEIAVDVQNGTVFTITL